MLGRMRRTREFKSQLFDRMMQRFGVTQRQDYGFAEGAMIHTAAARCIHCSEAARCRDWMDNTSGTEGASDFCPNARTFAALAARAHR